MPYEEVKLPVMHVKPLTEDGTKESGADPKDVILLHGGNSRLVFDTFMNWILQMKSADR